MRRFHPELYIGNGFFARLFKKLRGKEEYLILHAQDHLLRGDSRAAMVVSVSPLLVAAYTDELDCVAMLKFPDDLVKDYKLRVGTRLLTVNNYTPGETPVADLESGSGSYHRYSNFFPFIAEFLSNDRKRIEQVKANISTVEWLRTKQLAKAYLASGKRRFRDGLPLMSGKLA